MKKIIALSILTISFVLAGCQGTFNVIPADTKQAATKVGTASLTSILFFAPIIDNDVNLPVAMKNGGITNLHSVQINYKYFFIFNRTEITAYGN